MVHNFGILILMGEFRKTSKFLFHRDVLYRKENMIPKISHNYSESTAPGSKAMIMPKVISLCAHNNLFYYTSIFLNSYLVLK